MFLPNNPLFNLRTIGKRTRKRRNIEIRNTHRKVQETRNLIDFPLSQPPNWHDLPEDLMIFIFMKLDTTQLLLTVQHVCSWWWKLTKEPILYRSVFLGDKSVVFNGYKNKYGFVNYANLAKEAVHRSCGQLVQFSCGEMSDFTKELLHHIAASSDSGLKSLRLGTSFDLDIHVLTEVVKRIPSLEDLYFTHTICRGSNIEEIGRSCPKLRQLSSTTNLSCPQDAIAIARNMPSLHRLYLHGNGLTNDGLQAILDGCPRLEYIYLKSCFNIDLEDNDFHKKLVKRVKDIRLLKETNMKECEFDLTPADEEHSISDSLSLERYSQEFGDYALSLYNPEFKDSFFTHHYPWNQHEYPDLMLYE